MKNSKVKFTVPLKSYLFRTLIIFLSGCLIFFLITGNITSYFKFTEKKDFQLMYSFESLNFRLKEGKIKNIRSEKIIIGNTGLKMQKKISIEIKSSSQPLFWKYTNRDIFPVAVKREKPAVRQNKNENSTQYEINELPANMLIEISWTLLKENMKSEIKIDADGEILQGEPSTSLLLQAYHKLLTIFI